MGLENSRFGQRILVDKTFRVMTHSEFQFFLAECASWYSTHTPAGTVFHFTTPDQRFAVVRNSNPMVAVVDPKFIV